MASMRDLNAVNENDEIFVADHDEEPNLASRTASDDEGKYADDADRLDLGSEGGR